MPGKLHTPMLKGRMEAHSDSAVDNYIVSSGILTSSLQNLNFTSSRLTYIKVPGPRTPRLVEFKLSDVRRLPKLPSLRPLLYFLLTVR